MCGIAGLFSPEARTRGLAETAGRMADTLAHRGPDGRGVWTDPEAGIALGHRRLSIIDLSEAGAQPMASSCGRYVISYNGEVYNAAALRRELEEAGRTFRGRSDTETILEAVAEWGLSPALDRFIGMFAFAMWDTGERKLFLVRDRLGIKPLYYGRAGSDFVFGSELKALAVHPDFSREVDRDALALYFRHNYVPGPYCIYENAHKLQPGSLLVLDGAGGVAEPEIHTWWSAGEAYGRAQNDPFKGDEAEAALVLDELLTDAVGQRLVSDVPLGAFLSGGIDSSTVVALMQKASTGPVKTFSIGFNEAECDEAEHARAVAGHLGTDHTELTATPKDLLDTVPMVPTFWDEPFADASQIPTYLVSKLTRGHVTVSLSGDGGDELFFGYERYRTAQAWNGLRGVPRFARALTRGLAGGGIGRFLAARGPAGMRARWRMRLAGCRDFQEFYRYLMSHHKEPCCLVRDSREQPTVFTDDRLKSQAFSVRLAAFMDLAAYLPDDILAKVDRASMAVSLEARVPLLDHRVVEFAARLPIKMNFDGHTGKKLLKKVLYAYVPEKLVDRPKKGFGVPMDAWLRVDLRDWAESLLDERVLKEQGFLDPAQVRGVWTAYLAGKGNWSAILWDVLMFQAWMQANKTA